MGADCGTAIIDGVGLGFANAVERGSIGVVGASGTGIQEVTCLLDSTGLGISHAIGVGGRDLSSVVGGAMTMRGIELLDADESTSVIVVISKPPDEAVAGRVIEAAGRAHKPVVVGFLGGGGKHGDAPANVAIVGSLEAAARKAARLEGIQIEIESAASPTTDAWIRARPLLRRFAVLRGDDLGRRHGTQGRLQRAHQGGVALGRSRDPARGTPS